ncbi:MAG: YigZ family protein [Schleiferiaceae bacterium]|nr:YigZ family protein [Schleiferiaceae bacterium]
MTEDYSTYQTITESAQSLFKDRGSKFFGYAFPVASEENFQEQLEEIKKMHKQARHFCYAWRLDPRSQRYRANDDGEPAHSAGTPILHQMQSRDLYHVGVIVVRYFGGTKLGVPGLINAYKQAAMEALSELPIVQKTYTETLKITVGYEHLNKLLYWFRKYDVDIVKQDLALDCKYTVEVPEKNLLSLRAELKQENITFV